MRLFASPEEATNDLQSGMVIALFKIQQLPFQGNLGAKFRKSQLDFLKIKGQAAKNSATGGFVFELSCYNSLGCEEPSTSGPW